MKTIASAIGLTIACAAQYTIAQTTPVQTKTAAQSGAKTGTTVEREFEPPRAVRRAMKRFTDSGLIIRGYFPGPADLVGVAGLMYGSGLVFYVDKKGKSVIIGAAIDSVTGANLTTSAAAKFFKDVPDSNAVTLAAARQLNEIAATRAQANEKETPTRMPTSDELEQLGYVQQGAKSPSRILYAVADFQCAFCKEAFEKSEAWLAANPLTTIRWILIGDDARASFALGTKNYAHLRAGFSGVSGTRFTDAQNNTEPVSDERVKQALVVGAMALERNLVWVDGIGLKGTPTFFLVGDGRVTRHAGFDTAGYPAVIAALLSPQNN